MSTFQALCDQGRYTMKDGAAPGVRYKDATEMIAYCNLFMKALRRFRRDIFFATPYFTGALPTFALVDSFPLEDQYELALVDYLIYRAEAKNDEFGEDGKVAAFMQSANIVARGK